MGEKVNAFGKGGCGCLVAFALFAGFSLLLGGTAFIDIGGAILLFVIGGLLGLLVLWIYNRGKRSNASP